MRQYKRYQQSGTEISPILKLKWLRWLVARIFISAPNHRSDGIIITTSWPFLLEKPGIPQAALHLGFTASQQSVWILFIFFSTLACRCLRCGINLSAHHSLGLLSHAALHRGFTASRQPVWILFILFCHPPSFNYDVALSAHHSIGLSSHAALHRSVTASRQSGWVLIIFYFDTRLRRLWCGIILSAHHSLGLSSHAALHHSFTASRQPAWNLFI